MKYLFVLLISCSSYFVTQCAAQASGDEEIYVSFTLRNGGVKDIPLIIPGVMNPNLNPMGNSGVSLKVGQEILFKYKGKRQVLIVVDESLKGQVIPVHKLLKERKEEIDTELGKNKKG